MQKHLGVRTNNPQIYIEALTHKSAAGDEGDIVHGNERLEYLGDAILGSIAAEYLYRRFEEEDEGFLSKLRAQIVNRKNLNNLADAIHLPDIFQVADQVSTNQKFLFGNAFEALIGAIYLDKGYKSAYKVVAEKIFTKIDLEELQNTHDPKSRLYEWAQQHNQDLRFQVSEIRSGKTVDMYEASVVISGKTWGQGQGTSKKEAEKEAAQNTISNPAFKNLS